MWSLTQDEFGPSGVLSQVEFATSGIWAQCPRPHCWFNLITCVQKLAFS